MSLRTDLDRVWECTLELITEAVLPSETRDFEKKCDGRRIRVSYRRICNEKKRRKICCPVYWHLLNTVTPCNGAEAAQGRYIATMYKITEMDRLHEKYELHCSPLRIPEEYLVSCFHVCFRNENFQKFVFPAGVRYKTLQNFHYFFAISSCLRLFA
jgi:hypothetical protein